MKSKCSGLSQKAAAVHTRNISTSSQYKARIRYNCFWKSESSRNKKIPQTW
jgi:hypothetical protein